MRTIMGAHGAGDCLLALQCASFLTKEPYKILLSTRDEVFKIVDWHFGKDFPLIQVSEKYGEDNAILHTPPLFEDLEREFESFEKDKFYYVIPDLLYRNKYAFDYESFDTHPHLIKSARLLFNKWVADSFIYVGLISSTDGYVYENIPELLRQLGTLLPHYTIFCPWVTDWANKKIPQPVFDNLPSNVIVRINPSLDQAFAPLKYSSYFIGTDNGPSHFAYHYGMPRLILDPQYNKLPWTVRWREDINESISISSNPLEIARIVKTNLEIPQTTLIPRRIVQVNLDANWAQTLFFKY